MREFSLRTDLTRAMIDGFALPLGVEPIDLPAPRQGYTLHYVPGEDEEPDTYEFQIVASHEKIQPLLHRAFELLPDEVCGIVEIGSRDAYRSVDIFLSRQPISRDSFLETWRRFEPILLEEVALAAGANAEEPFIEVFLDQWKGVVVSVPLDMREEVESMLESFQLEQVEQTWPDYDDDEEEPATIRPVLDLTDEESPDLDDLLFELRYGWKLELGIDPEQNIDEAGRPLGLTLWHAVVMLDRKDQSSEMGSYGSVWATAASLNQMEQMLLDAFEEHPRWRLMDVFTLDRVAHDERPDELVEMPPRRHRSEVHLILIDAEMGESPQKRSAER